VSSSAAPRKMEGRTSRNEWATAAETMMDTRSRGASPSSPPAATAISARQGRTIGEVETSSSARAFTWMPGAKPVRDPRAVPRRDMYTTVRIRERSTKDLALQVEKWARLPLACVRV